ncbi:pyridoxamine 5'-phosphate oxidase family protein [Actinacidiphila glaucinigra]|uniref:pyridoxamine 5'-phosphate oxidase family protein n=1 Tax=Actinacidiphila glaucinigra TaxID=235986 RepID=UPI002E317306|nr:pyridoxamine 5'-phosphate oxidase family protein [Actinacidiphila glaucinigra]
MSPANRMTDLTGAEALWLLEGARCGRLVYVLRDMVLVRPAVHVLEYGALVVRAPVPLTAVTQGGDVTYHCERFHRTSGTGWSVTATGPAQELANAHETAHYRRTLTGWVHGPHDTLLRIHPLTAQGHRLGGPAGAGARTADDGGPGTR